MAKRKTDDPGKAIAEENARNLQAGLVRNSKGDWVDPSTLSPKQQEEEASQSNTPPPTPAMKAAEAAYQSANPTEDTYQQLADQQAQQFLQASKNLDPLTSGATLPATEQTASQNAAQMLGASSTSPVSQWLNAQTQAAQAQNAPALVADQQLASAQTSANQLMSQGLENMGTAESQMIQAAPYQQLLNTLAADVPYKLLGGATFQSLQPTIQQAEQSLGLTASPQTNPTVPAPQLPTLGAPGTSGITPPAPQSSGYQIP